MGALGLTPRLKQQAKSGWWQVVACVQVFKDSQPTELAQPAPLRAQSPPVPPPHAGAEEQKQEAHCQVFASGQRSARSCSFIKSACPGTQGTALSLGGSTCLALLARSAPLQEAAGCQGRLASLPADGAVAKNAVAESATHFPIASCFECWKRCCWHSSRSSGVGA